MIDIISLILAFFVVYLIGVIYICPPPFMSKKDAIINVVKFFAALLIAGLVILTIFSIIKITISNLIA